MPEKLSAETLLEILDHLPGVACATRAEPATGKLEWLYVSPKMAALYGVDASVLREDPAALMARIVEDDRLALEQLTVAGYQNLEPSTWLGRIHHGSGEVRWLESQQVFRRAADGAVLAYVQVADVTERKRTEAALAESERVRGEADALYQAVIQAMPVGIAVMKNDGTFLVYNTAAQRFAGPVVATEGTDLTQAFGIFELDGATPFPNEQLPLLRALGGEEAPEAEMIMRNGGLDGDCRLHTVGRPLRDGSGAIIAGMVSFQDVTQQRALEQELRVRNEQLSASEEVKTGLIERLRYAIDELSNPILEVWDDILVIPIIGVVDSRRTADMVQRLLAEVTRTQAAFVIVDLTGVEVVDTKTADHLMKLVRKVEIVGARCVLTGIRPAVSETLVDIGVDLGRLTTLRNLKHGLREALRVTRREREALRELSDDEMLDEPRRRQR